MLLALGQGPESGFYLLRAVRPAPAAGSPQDRGEFRLQLQGREEPGSDSSQCLLTTALSPEDP